MSIHVNYGQGVLSVPEKALDANAGLMELRVLLILNGYRTLADGFPATAAEIARIAGCEEGAVHSAVAFWRGADILQDDGETTAEPSHTVRADKALIRDAVPEYTGQQLSELIADPDKHMKFLIDECQNLLGKMFNQTEVEKIVALSDYLRFENEAILLLVKYCVGQNKRSVAYIVKTAYGLFNDGIDNYPKLDAYIKYKEKYYSVIGKLRALMGIGEREFSKKESSFIKQWIEDFDFSYEIVEYAYNITVDNKKELNFDYMGGILNRWHNENVHTVADIERLTREYQAQKQKTPENGSFNTDEFLEAAIKRSYDAMQKGV